MLNEGYDQWGWYNNFTGFEAPKVCFWCGEPTRGRYCTPEHQLEYLRHYWWAEANPYCWKRYDGKCADCGKGRNQTAEKNLYVHHIVPMDGEDRNWHWLNRPENLVLLCMEHHMQWHKELNYLERRYMEALNPQPPDPQLILFPERYDGEED